MTATDQIKQARNRNNELWMELSALAKTTDFGARLLHRIAATDKEVQHVAEQLAVRDMPRSKRLMLIAVLGRLRAVNNALWMDILHMAFDRDPVAAAELMGRIATNDAEITERRGVIT